MIEDQAKLQLTGERTLPGIPRENYWFMRHLVAYEYACDMASGKRVIDVGCGEGYGPALLARIADEVLGVDIAPEVVALAGRTYQAQNLSFQVMDVNSLDVPDATYDVAVSFQVVEHLVDEKGYFSEIARVLPTGGTAILSTPNRLTISPGSDSPINPFHLREYTPGEFHDTLSRYFGTVEILGLFHAGWLAANDRVKLVDFIKVYEMSRLNPRFWAHRLLTPRVRVDDFRLDGANMEECLDVFAVCGKPAPREARA